MKYDVSKKSNNVITISHRDKTISAEAGNTWRFFDYNKDKKGSPSYSLEFVSWTVDSIFFPDN